MWGSQSETGEHQEGAHEMDQDPEIRQTDGESTDREGVSRDTRPVERTGLANPMDRSMVVEESSRHPAMEVVDMADEDHGQGLPSQMHPRERIPSPPLRERLRSRRQSVREDGQRQDASDWLPGPPSTSDEIELPGYAAATAAVAVGVPKDTSGRPAWRPATPSPRKPMKDLDARASGSEASGLALDHPFHEADGSKSCRTGVEMRKHSVSVSKRASKVNEPKPCSSKDNGMFGYLAERLPNLNEAVPTGRRYVELEDRSSCAHQSGARSKDRDRTASTDRSVVENGVAQENGVDPHGRMHVRYEDRSGRNVDRSDRNVDRSSRNVDRSDISVDRSERRKQTNDRSGVFVQPYEAEDERSQGGRSSQTREKVVNTRAYRSPVRETREKSSGSQVTAGDRVQKWLRDSESGQSQPIPYNQVNVAQPPCGVCKPGCETYYGPEKRLRPHTPDGQNSQLCYNAGGGDSAFKPIRSTLANQKGRRPQTEVNRSDMWREQGDTLEMERDLAPSEAPSRVSCSSTRLMDMIKKALGGTQDRIVEETVEELRLSDVLSKGVKQTTVEKPISQDRSGIPDRSEKMDCGLKGSSTEQTSVTVAGTVPIGQKPVAVPSVISVTPSVASMKPRKLRGFSGVKEQTWEMYSAHLEIVQRMNAWDEPITLAHFCAELSGVALQYYSTLGPETKDSYEGVMTSMSQRFGTLANQHAVRSRLDNLRQKPEQTIEDVSQEVRSLAYAAFAKYPPEMREAEAVRSFMKALTSKDVVQALIQSSPISTMEKATEIAIQAREMGTAFLGRAKAVVVRRLEEEESMDQSSTDDEADFQHGDLVEEIRAVITGDRYRGRNQSTFRAGRADAGKITCWMCGEAGHIAQRCDFRPSNWPKWLVKEVQAAARGERVPEGSNRSEGTSQTHRLADTLAPVTRAIVAQPQVVAQAPATAVNHQSGTDGLILRLATLLANTQTAVDSASNQNANSGQQGQSGGTQPGKKNYAKKKNKKQQTPAAQSAANAKASGQAPKGPPSQQQKQQAGNE